MPSLVTSDTVVLHSGGSLPAPASPGDGSITTGFSALVRLSGGATRGGPLRLAVGLLAENPETVTDVEASVRVDGTWRTLAVAGTGTILFASLAIGPVPTEWVLELVGDAQDLAISAATAGGNTYTATARRLDEVP